MLTATIAFFIIVFCVIKSKYSNRIRIDPVEEERLNNAAPIQTLPVRIAGRRIMMHDVYHVRDVYHTETPFTEYYLRFEAPDGTSREMTVDQITYNTYQDGTIGTLTYQRKRFLSFIPAEMSADAQYGQGIPAQPEPGYPQQYQQDYSDQTPLY